MMEHISVCLISYYGMKINSWLAETAKEKIGSLIFHEHTSVSHDTSADIRTKVQRKHNTNDGQTCMSAVALNVCQMPSRHRDPKAGWKSPVCRNWLLLCLSCAWNRDSASMLTVWSQRWCDVYQKERKKKQSHIYNPRLWFDQCLAAHPVLAEVTVMTEWGLCCVCNSTLSWAGSQGTVGLVLNHSCRGRWRDRYLIQFLPGYLLLHWV